MCVCLPFFYRADSILLLLFLLYSQSPKLDCSRLHWQNKYTKKNPKQLAHKLKRWRKAAEKWLESGGGQPVLGSSLCLHLERRRSCTLILHHSKWDESEGKSAEWPGSAQSIIRICHAPVQVGVAPFARTTAAILSARCGTHGQGQFHSALCARRGQPSCFLTSSLNGIHALVSATVWHTQGGWGVEGVQKAERERESYHWEKIGVAGRRRGLLLEMHGHDIKYGCVIFSGRAEWK